MHQMTAQMVPLVEGNLALMAQPQGLRLIEGGLSDRANLIEVPRATKASAPSVANDLSPQQISLRQICRALLHEALSVRVDFFVVLLAAMSVLAIAWYAFDCRSEARAEQLLNEADYETIVVAEGDTLWGIAEQRQVDGCTCEQVIHRITEINSLDSAMLHEGDTLTVPK